MPEALLLTNTMSREKELFRSREERKVKIFTCGPSVYRRAHVGNYRTFLYEDILQRYLEYLGYRVERVMNFTDVEDKAIAEAKNQGIAWQELTTSVETRFLEETRMLGIKIPEIARSSTSVEQSANLIRILLDRGYAYRHDGDIFYDPLKFRGFGKLFGLDMKRWPKKKKRFRKDTYPGQRWNLGDFILWHGDKEEKDGPSWDTDIGRGRPAWNVQDAAMVTKHLGYQIDISCGGVDNLYRHHDYTIAVVEAVSGESFSSYWLHGAHVLVEGSKMSKTKGNIVYPDELLEKGYSAKDIRFSLIYTHYRRKLNLTDTYLEKSAGKLAAFKKAAKRLTGLSTEPESLGGPAEELVSGIENVFKERMNDDLDVQGAFESVYDILSRLLSLRPDGRLGYTTSSLLREHLERINGVMQILD
jgi:cysteinyl-tRNA synthetase